jgi:putative phosphoribosyl transferase
MDGPITESRGQIRARDVRIASGSAALEGELDLPAGATGVVLFAHGSGSSRHSSRNQYVARIIREAGIGTLLFDLLTQEEEAIDLRTAHLRFDIGLLARRLVDATRWISQEPETRQLRVGYFGASTGGGAALVAAAELRSCRAAAGPTWPAPPCRGSSPPPC